MDKKLDTHNTYIALNLLIVYLFLHHFIFNSFFLNIGEKFFDITVNIIIVVIYIVMILNMKCVIKEAKEKKINWLEIVCCLIIWLLLLYSLTGLKVELRTVNEIVFDVRTLIIILYISGSIYLVIPISFCVMVYKSIKRKGKEREKRLKTNNNKSM